MGSNGDQSLESWLWASSIPEALCPGCQAAFQKWLPLVHRIAKQFSLMNAHGDSASNEVKAPSFPGDNPVFIYNQVYIMKFFSKKPKAKQIFNTEVRLFFIYLNNFCSSLIF